MSGFNGEKPGQGGDIEGRIKGAEEEKESLVLRIETALAEGAGAFGFTVEKQDNGQAMSWSVLDKDGQVGRVRQVVEYRNGQEKNMLELSRVLPGGKPALGFTINAYDLRQEKFILVWLEGLSRRSEGGAPARAKKKERGAGRWQGLLEQTHADVEQKAAALKEEKEVANLSPKDRVKRKMEILYRGLKGEMGTDNPAYPYLAVLFDMLMRGSDLNKEPKVIKIVLGPGIESTEVPFEDFGSLKETLFGKVGSGMAEKIEQLIELGAEYRRKLAQEKPLKAGT